MHDLHPVTALGGHAPRVDIIGTVTITEQPDVALASVAARLGRSAETTGVLANLIDAAIPGPGRSASGGDYAIFWTGPDQWMVVASVTDHEDLAARLAARLKGTASVTEQSGAWVQFDVRGQARIDMMERLCALPTRTMQADEANRTHIAQMGCFVRCFGDGFGILGPRSSAKSLHHALITAARSVV